VVLCVLAALGMPALATSRKKLPKPGWNLFSRQQDIQLGREYAVEVERDMQVVQNKELTDYVTRVGMRLVRKGGLDEYPYYFKVVKDDSINAFALPGGPMYIHTGLLKAVENEAQLAGVLSHELSHIVLRHGTHQATKSQFLQIGSMVLSGATGGLSGQLSQLGIGLGANSLLLSFSRGMESEADLLGAYTMAQAGYNPIELPRFFERLESDDVKHNALVSRFLSDHPSPGNRIQTLEEQLPFMPRGPYDAQAGDLAEAQQIVARLESHPIPAYPAGEPVSPQSVSLIAPALKLNGRYRDYQKWGTLFVYPEEWQVVPSSDNSFVVTGNDGLVGKAIGYGILVSVHPAERGRVNLTEDTAAYLQKLAQSTPNVKLDGRPEQAVAGGAPALLTRLVSDSPYIGHKETDLVLTVDRGDSLLAFVFIAPQLESRILQDIYRTTIQSMRFTP
jgi:hypothetical protein